MMKNDIEMEDNHIKNMHEKKEFIYTGTNLEVIDYVVVYNKAHLEENPKKEELRNNFENALQSSGLILEEVADPKNPDIIFVRIHTPFERLVEEAERMKLEMPLLQCQIYEDPEFCFEHFEQKYLVTDTEDDFVSAPFRQNRLHLFKGYDDPATFFRSSTRSYLTHHILIHTDIREDPLAEDAPLLSKKALPHLLMTGVYTDSFILHEPSVGDPVFKEFDKTKREKDPEMPMEIRRTVDNFTFRKDHRQSLNNKWVKMCKYQPMWKIRNYFGEKIAFYFAWSGHLISWLWLPTIFGLVCFIYGLYLSILENLQPASPTNTTSLSPIQKVAQSVENMLGVVKQAFDNVITPFFALTICIWGTILTETWKRTRHRLAYEWDVNNFSDTEPDRPQFVGTALRLDPVTKEEDWYYPMRRQFMKFGASFVILLFMICIVFISVASVILYRVFVTVKYCKDGQLSTATCFVINVIVSSVLNATSILLLGKFYDFMAMKLTDWENHRTQTAYDDALVIKLFAFQFANSYSSLIYIAFFRGNISLFSTNGVFGLGEQYIDSCGSGKTTCMPMLSFQVLVLMLMKPLPKLLIDIVLPFAIRILRTLRKRCGRGNRITNEDMDTDDPQDLQMHLEYEKQKPSLKDFTISEYMEKVIQYGYLMLFASSFPLAPLIALLTNIFDRMVDAKRLLWMYRRPIPQIVHSIGMWESIVEFLNAIGVITNAFIIAFTSSWGAQFTVTTRLIIVLGVEHAVFGIKLFTMAIIPDIPADVKLSIRREKFQVRQVLETGNIEASSISLGPHRLKSRQEPPQNLLSRLPLNTSSSSSHPSPFEMKQAKRDDSFNTHEAKLHFGLYSSAMENDMPLPSNRLPPIKGDNRSDDEISETQTSKRKRKNQDSELDTVAILDNKEESHNTSSEV